MTTIMIVDAHAERVHQLKSLLDDQYTVITASSSKEALEHLDTAHDNPVDLLLVNTQIPGTTNHSFLSVKPTQSFYSMDKDVFIPFPLEKEALHRFIQQQITEKE